MLHTKSHELFINSKNYIPGGVNSPVRAFKSVDMNPLFIKSAKGCKITDADNNDYIDYVGAYGPMILGHGHPKVINALKGTLENGFSFGATAEAEVELAKIIVDALPSVERIRLVNSGTEATMSALRLARGFTSRDIIVKMIGCYHGHADSLLVKAGSGAATFGTPDSKGVTKDMVSSTLCVPYNNINTLSELFKKQGDNIAAVIIEPVAGNMGVVLPAKGYLEKIRELTKQHGTVLIFDEVMTGFRLAYGGVQNVFDIKPDLTCLGKVIGGGLPVGAFGGKSEIMDMLAPEGPVYQAGTLSGNGLAVRAGIETLKEIKKIDAYSYLEEIGNKIEKEILKISQKHSIPIQINRIGSMFSLFFTDTPVIDFETASTSLDNSFKIYFKALLKNGIYIPPSRFEAYFLSIAIKDEEIEKTLSAVDAAFRQICK